jgi:hypothetical protein
MTMQRVPSPLYLRQRLAIPVGAGGARVAGVGDLFGSDAGDGGSGSPGLGDLARKVGTQAGEVIGTVNEAIKAAGEGAREAGRGIGAAADRAGSGVSIAAESAADTAATTAKWAIGLAIGIPVTLGLAGLAAFVLAARSAGAVAEQLGPEGMDLLIPLLGPEAAAAVTLAKGARRARRQDVGARPLLVPGDADAIGALLTSAPRGVHEAGAGSTGTPRRYQAG